MTRIVTTTWRPDTGGGRITYDWDRDVPAAQRVHFNWQILENDGLHGDLDGDDFCLALWGDNQMKNLIEKMVRSRLQTTDDAPLDWQWSFDAQRVLHIEIGGFNADRNFVQGAADTQFGPGRVAVDG